MTQAHKTAPAEARPARARRILSLLVRGLGLDAIGAQEKAPLGTVQAIVQEELDRRWVPPISGYAKLQIARLEKVALQLADAVERAELPAVDRMFKVLDRLDRYHGFTRASPAAEPYGDEERALLLERINAIAERLDDPDDGDAPAR